MTVGEYSLLDDQNTLEDTHYLKRDPDLEVVARSECSHDDADAGRVTYLAVDWSRSISINQVKDYVQEAGSASEGVNLTKLLFSPILRVGGKTGNGLQLRTQIVQR